MYRGNGTTIPDLSQWHDYGLAGITDDAAPGQMPEDFRRYARPDFGLLAETMGILDGVGLGFAVEATPELYGNQVLARTPLLELDPDDYRYVQVMRRPYEGMVGLGDDGQIYQYDGSLGFFRKIFRRIKKGVKKVAKRIRSGIRKVISKIPGGKYLIRLGEKIFSIAKKLVKPLVKWVGPLAKQLSPIAAIIPGYGPAIAAGLLAVGKISDLMKQTGAVIKTVKGAARLKFPSGQAGKAFVEKLRALAKAEKGRQERWGPPYKAIEKLKQKAAKSSRRPMGRRTAARRPVRSSAAMLRRRFARR